MLRSSFRNDIGVRSNKEFILIDILLSQNRHFLKPLIPRKNLFFLKKRNPFWVFGYITIALIGRYYSGTFFSSAR